MIFTAQKFLTGALLFPAEPAVNAVDLFRHQPARDSNLINFTGGPVAALEFAARPDLMIGTHHRA